MAAVPRRIFVLIAVLFVALGGLGGYTGFLQARLSADLSEVDDRLSAALAVAQQELLVRVTEANQQTATDLATAKGELSADLAKVDQRVTSEITRTAAFLSVELDTQTNALESQLDTLGAALRQEVSDTAAALDETIDGVGTRLDSVKSRLDAADTALEAELSAQDNRLTGSLATLSTSVTGLSTNLTGLSTDFTSLSADLTDLEDEAGQLGDLTARALLDAAPLYASVRDSVVMVLNSDDFTIGSGFVYGADAEHVVTAWHVVDGESSFSVQLVDGTVIGASVAASDTEEDIVVLELSTAAGVGPLPLADSSQLVVGEPVLVVGHPVGLTYTATTGVIGAVGRSTEDFAEDFFDPGDEPTDLVQIDATAAPGSSGGPVFNRAGEVVGIVSFAVVSEDTGNTGLNFAVASNLVQALADSVVGG